MAENISFEDVTGKRCEVPIDITDYKEAGLQKISLSQLYANKFPTAENSPSAFQQFCAASGIRVRPDHKRGIPASTMHEILHGGTNKYMGSIIRPDGSGRQSTSGRLLYPEVMLQLIEGTLRDNKEDYLTPWESAIALRYSVSSPRVDQPTIDVTAPEGSAASPIAQGSEPDVMVSISLSERAYKVPTKSIGLTITDEALQATTIDLVGITLAAQARGERIRRIETDMGNIINGDVDSGVAATPFALASSFTTEVINATTPITQRVFVKWLRANYQRMTVTHILGDVDALLDVEARSGKPTVLNDTTLRSNILDPKYTVENMGLPTPQVLLLPTAIVGAGQLIGFDSDAALHEITNVSASYSAVENFVMRRTTDMRFDFGISLVKLWDGAFTGLTMGA